MDEGSWSPVGEVRRAVWNGEDMGLLQTKLKID